MSARAGRPVVRLLVLAAVFAAMPRLAWAEWVRLESPNFVVFGEIGDKRTRQFAADFERFREALGRIVAGAAVPPSAPTLVFIFKDAKSFAPYRPLYNGKPVEVSGYFAGAPSINVIMLPATNREGALRTIYHEYSHLITANVANGLPVWMGEGLADYYSTFEVKPDGRQAVLGQLIPEHLLLLHQDGFLPLEQLLAVEHDSPLYNEGSRRSTFYAQSWALVHMLLNGKQNRSREFSEYAALTAAGRPPVDAWRQVFGSEKINEQLRRYIEQSQLKAFGYTFTDAIEATTFSVSSPSPADVHAALGDLRLRITPDAAPEHMKASPSPETLYTKAVRGLLELEKQHSAEALALLTDAARGSNDWLVQYQAAVGLERLATATEDEASRTAGRIADAALLSVLKQKPNMAHAIALRGIILGASDEGLALIDQARRLAPARPYYAIWQAQYHAQRGEFDKARALLGPLMSPMFPKETREYARRVMGEAVTFQQQRAAAMPRSADRGSSADAPAGATADQPWRPTPGRAVPLFREVRAGEQRIEARLERIECPRAGVILHVRLAAGPAKYSAESFDHIEFLTYRDDVTGSVQCGPRPTLDRIYLTFRPVSGASTTSGTAVAVEFLPR